MSGRDDKAARYIASLDAARCNAAGTELPELIRKVKKHAPQRKALTVTASCECEAFKHATTSKGDASSTDLAALIPELVALPKHGGELSEQEIQTQTCLAWVYWLAQNHEKVLETLQADYTALLLQYATERRASSSWTEICLAKSAYMRGCSLLLAGRTGDALREWHPILRWLDDNQTRVRSSAQLSYWVEQLTAQLAVAATKQVNFGNHDAAQLGLALRSFRVWASFASHGKEVTALTFGNSPLHLLRLDVWKANYSFLSMILQSGVPYPSDGKDAARPMQSGELRRVEMMYESELLRRTRFPKATDSNVVMEDWVEKVIQNWQALCGDHWHDDDLGEGGRNGFSRNVLETLYRAAGKTFHSTLILRRLFQVHKSLADFDLAYKALETYIELIERGRARAAKSNETASGQDDDETVLRTISEGIEGLCAFGSQNEAEKAYELSQQLETWLERLLPDSSEEAVVNGHTEGETEGLSEVKSQISPPTCERVYRATGIAQAQWAKWTPFSEKRTELQSDAIKNLQKATEQESSDDGFLGSTWALAFLLAETRDIERATFFVKKALTAKASTVAQQSYDLTIERKQAVLWHLLALLLTAQQDFNTAEQICAAAFERFQSSEILLAKAQPGLSSKKSLKPPSLVSHSQVGLVDDMECDELQRFIEIRISELALAEILEGPEDAVNASNQLLSLYARLFGRFGVGIEDKSGSKSLLDPPQSSATTVKSFRGSLFGRKKISPSLENLHEKTVDGSAASNKISTRPTTQGTEAPTIQVTDEHGKSPTNKHHIFRRSEERTNNVPPGSPKSHKKHSSLSKILRPHSREESSEQPNLPATNQATQSEKSTKQAVGGAGSRDPRPDTVTDNTVHPHHTTDEIPAPPTSLTAQSSPEAIKGMQSNTSPTTEQEPHTDPSSGVIDRKFRRHSRSNTKIPASRFPKDTQQKHSLALLTKIWLVIATLYRRANMFDDAREACDEAAKCAQKIETIVATVESSARAFAAAGWGGSGKSSDEIWADVFCERAQLALTIAYLEEKKGQREEVDVEKVREAVEAFEQCLMFFPDHARGIVGLSGVLLDYYERKIDLGRKVDDGKPQETKMSVKEKRAAGRVASGMQNGVAFESSGAPAPSSSSGVAPSSGPTQTDDELKKTPENLNRLAARDRAYGLLSTLTKLGTGWDNSEAWFALARAHELGGEIEKAKEILWWCVELEDQRPIRHWRNVSTTGYVL